MSANGRGPIRSGHAGELLHELALEVGLARPGPRDFRRSDRRVREDICERLMHDHEVDVSDVSVEVADGLVRLDGTVPQRHMRYRIEDVCAACPGVVDVENRLRVVPSRAGDV